MPLALAMLLGAASFATWEISGNVAEAVSFVPESDGGMRMESTIPMRSYTDDAGMTTWLPESV